MTKIKPILFADDNPMDVELTLEALSGFNFANQIIVTRDGVETMEYLKREGSFKDRKPGNPAALILDIKMPRMDGIEVLRQIRANEDLKLLPVVILTSSREEHDLYKSYELGVNAYAVKPLNFNDFAEAVKTLGVFWAVINVAPPGAR